MSSPLDSLDLDALPDDVRVALAAVETARQQAEARADRLEEKNRRLEHLLKELRRAQFGRRSEKISSDQLELAFEALETALAETDAVSGGSQAAPDACDRRNAQAKRNLGHLPKQLPRIERIIEPDDIQCPCGCGEMKRIGEDRSERLDIIPAQLQVIVTIRPKYACGNNSCDGKIKQAPAPAFLIEAALPTEGTIAHVLVSKYADHLPLYRQSQIYARSGIDLHRSTLAGWAGRSAFHLRPVVERMNEHLKSSTKLFMDETTAPVLDPGRRVTTRGAR